MKRDFKDSYLERNKRVLNEIADENIIYDETQTGPQEEPFLFEYHVNVAKWRKYHAQKLKQQKHSNRNSK